MADPIRIPVLADNYVWLFPYAPGRAAVIDPAVAPAVLETADIHGLRITHILNTHWHPDHVGGNEAIKAATGCMVAGPAREAARIPGLDLALDDGDTITLDGVTADILFVGAHTAGHIAYHFAGERLLFPGDTLFAMGCGRLFEGSAADMFAALGRLKALPGDTLVCCAHEYTLSNARFAVTVEPGNAALMARFAEVEAARAAGTPTVPFRLCEELETNPFIRARDVAELAARRSAKDAF
jgi:hydroxyacylglutathione hydrolase